MSDREELLEEVLEQVKTSHKWMLASIKRGSDEVSGGNYSDELKHALAVQETLEAL